MLRKKNLEKNDNNSIPIEIIEALSNLEPDFFIRTESCPCYVSDNYIISSILDESKTDEKEEEEKECQIGNYMIKKTLGKGTFGKVKLGIYIPTQEKVAIKILEKSRIVEKDDEIRVKREFELLTLFNHPNVILVAEIFESAGKFYSVMEYCEGGELFNYIVKNRRLSQNEAAFFYYQLINGLEYIHSLGIVHRDLKPENLLLTKDHILKIIDFGLSNYFKKGQKDLLVTPCGSPCYASPEMVAGKKYNGFKIDIWSTGIILYAMLCGYLPFEDKDNDVLFEKILECNVIFPRFISKIGKDLIKKILVTDPNKRISIKEIKNHPFYLKGKELFESEFNICKIEKDKIGYINGGDINNIMDIHILNYNNHYKENKNQIKKKEKEKEKSVTIKKEKPKLKQFEKENLILRINTEGDEEKKSLALRNEYLPDLVNGTNAFLRKTDNHSSKKLMKKNEKIQIKNKNINKEKGPFLNRDIFFKKNNIKKINLKNVNENTNKKEPNNNKILIKSNKYNNIKNQFPRKYIIGKSVNIRKINHKLKYENLIQHKINDTNIIKSKFNSKEKFDKNKIVKKENIYTNNINHKNNIYNNQFPNKKLNLKFNLDIFNSAEQTHRKANSMAKKNKKLTTFQTIENQRKNKNYLDNLFNLNSNIKKFKQQLIDIKLNDMKINDNIAIKLRNKLNKISSEEKRVHNKVESEVLCKEKSKKMKINKDKLKLTKIYDNIIDNKNEYINIIDNTEEEKIIKNKIKNISQTFNTDRENSFDNSLKKPKTKRGKFIKKNLFNLKYYINKIEKNQTSRKEREKKSNHSRGVNTDLINNIDAEKECNFNLKKISINDVNNKNKCIEKEKILIFENLQNDDINLNIINDINKTEPNQIIHIKKKIKDKNKNEQLYNLSNENKNIYKKINKKINIHKNIHLNTNNFIKKQKINFKENKIIEESNYEKNYNKTSNNFNKIFDSINLDKNERNNKCDINSLVHYVGKKNNERDIIMNRNKKPNVTIKNTVINLNIDTGFIIHPFNKGEKIKQINQSKINDYLMSEISENNRYIHINKNKNYINKEKIRTNIIHHDINETRWKTSKIDNNLFNANENINDEKIISKKLIVYRDNKGMKMIEGKNLNKTMNNNINKHTKLKSMKL